MRNPLNQLKELLGEPVTIIGTVLSSTDGTLTIEETGGGVSTAKGVANVGTKIYVKDGVIAGPAPELPTFSIEV